MSLHGSLYPPGTHLSCTTTLGASIKGNVIATDESFGTLVVRDGGSSGCVHVINLRYLTELNVLPSSSSDSRHIPSKHPVSLSKVHKKLDNSLEARRIEVESRGVNVTPHGQQVFDKIRKIYSDTRWHGHVIVVLEDAHISPPYTPNTITGSSNFVKTLQKQLFKFTNGD